MDRHTKAKYSFDPIASVGLNRRNDVKFVEGSILEELHGDILTT